MDLEEGGWVKERGAGRGRVSQRGMEGDEKGGESNRGRGD